jgi:hypothetical protein
MYHEQKSCKCQNKCCLWRLLLPSDHFMDGEQWWMRNFGQLQIFCGAHTQKPKFCIAEWLIQEERQITVIDIAEMLNVSCGSAYSSFMGTSGMTKSVQGGCQRSLQMSTSVCQNMLQFLQQYCEERQAFLHELLQAVEHGCTTMNLQVNITVWNGNI